MGGDQTRWTRVDERAWLGTLSREALAGYLRALPYRAVDFEGNPVTREFLLECRVDHARAAAQAREASGLDG